MTDAPETFWNCLESIEAASLSLSQQQWLSNKESLTVRLRAMFGDKIDFYLKKEQIDTLYPGESRILQLSTTTQQWVREIEWHVSNQIVIVARVVIPLGSQHPLMNKIYTLGAASIGDILFEPGGFVREEMSFAKLDSSSPYAQLVQQRHCALTEEPLWARRSLFCCEKERLLVNEVFLPQFFSLVAGKE